MIRSATPAFAFFDRFREEGPRPGVDYVEAAGTPQQNPVETAVWAVFVTGLMAACSMRLLTAIGIEGVSSGVLVLPVTFVALHLGIVLFGAVADLIGSRIGAWIVGCSAIAGWLVLSSGGTNLVGRAWLVWMLLNALAWGVNALWKTSTVASR